jgi:hypothetical protein
MDTVLVTIGEFVSDTGAKSELTSTAPAPARSIPAPVSRTAGYREEALKPSLQHAPKLRALEPPRVPLASLGQSNSDLYVGTSATLTLPLEARPMSSRSLTSRLLRDCLLNCLVRPKFLRKHVYSFLNVA